MRISTSQIYQNGISNLLAQQEKLVKAQEEIATGKRVQTTSDDPMAALQIGQMNKVINETQLLQNNRQSVEVGLKLEAGVLSSSASVIQSLSDIQLRASSSNITDTERQSLAEQVRGLLGQLVSNSNSKDMNGNYMFGGGQSDAPAFSLVSGSYVYNGDSTQRYQAVAEGLQIAVNDPGNDVFMTRNGNGSFTVSQPAVANSGTLSVGAGFVTDEAAYDPTSHHQYTIQFVANGGGFDVSVTDDSIPAVVAGFPQAYNSGDEIVFDGRSVVISGTPVSNDSFIIEPAEDDSVFATAQRMIANLSAPNSTAVEKSLVQTENNQLLAQIRNSHSNILNRVSEVGQRIDLLKQADNINKQILSLSEDVASSLRDVDPAAAIVRYNAQLTNLQAAQQSFVRIQGLSVFNYL